MPSTINYSMQTEQFKNLLNTADAVFIGAGAGLSTSAGFTYSGERFERYFSDFIAKYHFKDMYTAGFQHFSTLEEHWAYWSRHIYWNRYVPAPIDVYGDLLNLVKDKDYFVLSTNADHQFQKSGFDKKRLFYTQGDYGLWQCPVPCHNRTYDNEAIVREMIVSQHDMLVPSELVPHCPVCGKAMKMNLRADSTFVEDEGWHAAANRYEAFVTEHSKDKVLYLELGVGENTPGIIKYNFWRQVYQNPSSHYVTINQGDAYTANEISARSICINRDIGQVLSDLLTE
jgi:NAD-dependent SIR2 family protein deacetylase